MRRRAKHDANQPEIVAALRGIGATVTIVDHEAIPDLIVLYDCVYLIEVKVPGGKLTPKQVAWHEQNQSPQIGIVESVDEALTLIGAID